MKNATVLSEAIEMYIGYCNSYYAGSREPNNLRSGLLRFFGDSLDLSLDDIRTPLIARLRDHHARQGELSRSYINKLLGYLRRFGKWAAEYGIVEAAVFHEIAAVGNIGRGRHGVAEAPPVSTVSPEIVERTQAGLSPQLSAYIDMMRATGMRPGEARVMRPCDLELVGKRAMVYTPQDHKNKHRGRSRYIAVIGDAFKLAEQLSQRVDSTGYLFSPDGDGTRPYAECSIAQAIRRVCDDLGVERWSPNQLRHLFATDRYSQGHEPEAITPVLGHATTRTTLIYIHEQKSRVVEAAKRLAC